jgi:hypothetical protein
VRCACPGTSSYKPSTVLLKQAGNSICWKVWPVYSSRGERRVCNTRSNIYPSFILIYPTASLLNPRDPHFAEVLLILNQQVPYLCSKHLCLHFPKYVRKKPSRGQENWMCKSTACSCTRSSEYAMCVASNCPCINSKYIANT